MKNMSEIKPLRPNDITNNLEKIIPAVVITAVNNLLTKGFRGVSVTLKLKDIITEICRLDESMTSEILFQNKWVDFEDVYRKYGWSVTYDKPSYRESYEPTFEFKPKITTDGVK